mmetsp:Transcript_16594/g.34040  ORF Transcript_16594/g.34040 Transcript_16594/m.34040 type:complete len:209 (+) Transcript_16594:106-732(+)
MTPPLRQPESKKYTYPQADRDQLKNVLDHVTAQLKAHRDHALSKDQIPSSDHAVPVDNPATGIHLDSSKKSPKTDVEKPSDPFASYRSPCIDDDDDDSSDDEDKAEDGEEQVSRDLESFSSFEHPSNSAPSAKLFASTSASTSLSPSDKDAAKRKFTPWDPYKYRCANYYGSMGEKVWTDEEKKQLLAFVNKWIPTDGDHKRMKPPPP